MASEAPARVKLPSNAEKVAGLGLALALFASPVLAADPLTGIASVIDADTIELHGTRIRLVGIDAPEGRQTCDLDGQPWRCGQAAALALADHIEGKTLDCRGDDLDRYGRRLTVCYIGTEDVNGWLVSEGWAMAYRRYSVAYVPQEDSARIGRRGIWAGTFQMPWDWRKAH